MAFVIGAPASLTVRAATHVNPKATKHHTKTRPKKVRAAHRAPQDRPPKTLNPETRGPGRGRARASPARARAASTSPPASAHLLARTPTPRRLARRLTSPHPPPPLPRSSSQLRVSDRNRKKVEYPEIKEEEKPPVMTVMSEK